jgi:hypothetical protein
MASGDYLHNHMTSPLPNQQSELSNYPVQLTNSVDSYVANNFSGQDLGPSGDDLFRMDFNSAPFSNYESAGNMQVGDFGLNDGLMGAVENGTGTWEQIDASRRLQYEHRQR